MGLQPVEHLLICSTLGILYLRILILSEDRKSYMKSARQQLKYIRIAHHEERWRRHPFRKAHYLLGALSYHLLGHHRRTTDRFLKTGQQSIDANTSVRVYTNAND
jgi:hypothetical protein